MVSVPRSYSREVPTSRAAPPVRLDTVCMCSSTHPPPPRTLLLLQCHTSGSRPNDSARPVCLSAWSSPLSLARTRVPKFAEKTQTRSEQDAQTFDRSRFTSHRPLDQPEPTSIIALASSHPSRSQVKRRKYRNQLSDSSAIDKATRRLPSDIKDHLRPTDSSVRRAA